VTITNGRLLCNGVELLVSPERLLVTNNNSLYAGNHSGNNHVAFAFGTFRGAAFGNGSILRSYPNSKDSEEWARAQMALDTDSA